MNDKELADAVERILGFAPDDMFGDEWATDWRVAGALMEKVWYEKHIPMHIVTNEAVIINFNSEMPIPRAIIEACVEALGE